MLPFLDAALRNGAPAPQPSFDLPLLTTLVPTRALGSPTPTFTRATTATVMGTRQERIPVTRRRC